LVTLRRQPPLETTGPVSWPIFEGDSFDVRRITLKFVTAPTVSDLVTVTLDSLSGTPFDVPLCSANPNGRTSVVFENITGIGNGDKIVVSYANSESIAISGNAETEPTSSTSASVPSGVRVSVDGLSQSAAYDASDDAVKVEEQRPASIRYLQDTVSTGAVPNGTPYSFLVDMNGYQGGAEFGIEKTNASTDTFAVTYDSSVEGYAAGDDWLDSYTNGFDLVAGTDLTTDHIVKTKTGHSPAGIKVTITTAGGSGDAEFDIHYKKWPK
jgi:hypothetical protein